MKKLKRLLSIIVMAALLVPAAAHPAFAKASQETGDVLALIKPRIPDTADYPEFESSVQETDGIVQYYFSWYSDGEDGYKSMNVTSSKDGVITSYHSYDTSMEKPRTDKLTINKLSSDKALISAAELVDKLNPALKGDMQLTKNNVYESLFDEGYSYRIQRTKNNIPVYGDTGYVTISSDCQRILSFNLNYSQSLSFEDGKNIITAEKAKENYCSKIGMELVYKTSYEDEAPSAYLAYIPKKNGVYIDALSGDSVSPQSAGQYRYASSSLKNEAAMDSEAGGAFSQAELNELEKLDELISIDKIEEIIKSNKYIKLPKGSMLKSKYLVCGLDEEYVYNIEYNNESEYAHISVNAVTGEILSVYQSAEHSEGEVSAESAKKIAEYFAPQRFTPDDKGEYRFFEQSDNSFKFVRYVNDIPYYDNTIRISINPADGQLISYCLNHRSKVEFMYPEALITSEEGCSRLFEQVDYSVYYYPCISSEGAKHNDTAKLLYMPESGKDCTVYADTGKLVYEGDLPKIGSYNDISGHYAEEVINTLSRFGIGFDSDSFCPDEIITQKDFSALLTSVVSGGDGVIIGKDYAYTNAYSRAHNIGIIKPGEESPDSEVTRESACVYMIRAIGLEAAAELESIYIPQFEDVTKNTGYISILSAMKVINGYNGSFNPDLPLTRADAMIMIYNYLR